MKSTEIIDPDSIAWSSIGTGVYRKDIAYNSKTKQFFSFLKIKKDAQLKTHKHSDIEWVFVVEGIYEDEFGSAKKGAVKINAKGSIHTSRSRKGCILLVVWSGNHTLVKNNVSV